jgi:hypothetical protein
MYATNVWMADRTREKQLLPKRFVVARHARLFAYDLEGDLLLRRPVEGEEDLAHATLAEALSDFVTIVDDRSGSDRGGRSSCGHDEDMVDRLVTQLPKGPRVQCWFGTSVVHFRDERNEVFSRTAPSRQTIDDDPRDFAAILGTPSHIHPEVSCPRSLHKVANVALHPRASRTLDGARSHVLRRSRLKFIGSSQLA